MSSYLRKDNMCGITGIIDLKEKNSIDKTILKKMTDILSHRGPDQSGLYTDEHCGMGHRRLSIIDLSRQGKQPMSNKDNTLHIVFNGEIYNYQDIRKSLESKYDFSSNTDTEVILYGYQEYGTGILDKLVGMFAFAVWDSKEKTLFLARDRIGQKPLVYYHKDNRIVFASEIKSILVNPEIERRVDRKALSAYLTLGYVPSPMSIFEGIKKLKPGHYMLFGKGRLEIKKYWDIRFKEGKSSEEYLKKGIIKHLDESTKIRLKSDVPLGAFLSGGIDSSAVVAFMAKNMEEPVKTFSIGFEEQSFDETRYARLIAERYNTDHKEFIVKPECIEILPKLVWHYNEPFADSSSLPTYYVARMTRKHVTVALNGDAGDENFAGYERYAADKVLDQYDKLPGILKKSFNKVAMRFPEPTTQKNILRKIKRVVQVSSLSNEERYLRLLSIFSPEQMKEMASDKGVSDTKALESFKRFYSTQKEQLNRKLYCDMKCYLPDDLLVKVDIATMANSLEGRSPFLDHRFIEFAATIPPNLKLKGLEKKYILKKALLPYIPKKILNRKKMGFGTPVGKWFKSDLREISQDIILSKEAKARGYFRQDQVEKLFRQHLDGKMDHGYRIWSLLWLELWHRIYIDDFYKKGDISIKNLV